MTNEESYEKILALEKCVSQNQTTLLKLVVIVEKIIEQNEQFQKFLDEHTRTETDTWRTETEERRPEPTPEITLPTVYTTKEPPPSWEQQIQTQAAYFLSDAGKNDRKQAEDYLKNRDDQPRRRSMLHLLLEMLHEKEPELPPEEKEKDFACSDDELEEMLQLNLDVAAIEYLRSQGK